MSGGATYWAEGIASAFAQAGYSVIGAPVGSGHLATKRIRSLGPFFPVDDFVFIHSLSASTSAETFEQLHEAAREYAEGQFKLPRTMRYRIPNTISIGVSPVAVTPELIAYVESNKLASPMVGGQKHSTFLVDAHSGQMYSAGLEQTPGVHGTQNTSRVNPTNRVYLMMNSIHGRLVAAR